MGKKRDKVIGYLQDQGIEFEIIEHQNAVFTCAETATERKVSLEQVTKSLVCFNKKKELCCFLIPGSENLNHALARKACQSNKLRFVDKAILTEQYDLTIGAICPLQLIGKSAFFMDEKLYCQPWLTMSTGEPNSGIKLATSDLFETLQAKVYELT